MSLEHCEYIYVNNMGHIFRAASVFETLFPHPEFHSFPLDENPHIEPFRSYLAIDISGRQVVK